MRIFRKKFFAKYSFSILFFNALFLIVYFLSPVNVLRAESRIVNPSSQTEQWANLKESLFSNRKVKEKNTKINGD